MICCSVIAFAVKSNYFNLVNEEKGSCLQGHDGCRFLIPVWNHVRRTSLLQVLQKRPRRADSTSKLRSTYAFLGKKHG